MAAAALRRLRGDIEALNRQIETLRGGQAGGVGVGRICPGALERAKEIRAVARAQIEVLLQRRKDLEEEERAALDELRRLRTSEEAMRRLLDRRSEEAKKRRKLRERRKMEDAPKPKD